MNNVAAIAEARTTPTSAVNTPDVTVQAREVFKIDVDLDVPAFSVRTEHVPEIDPAYQFDRETTLAILAGFAFNRRVMIQGYHGTGKSTHIEQVAARLNWPCIRVNLDSHISRIDLIGKDAIVLKDGKQVTEFREGILPWALQHPCALVFDEYDAGRPDVMFVIQRVLEVEGRLTLLDQNRVIRPHAAFRLRRHDRPVPRHPADQPGPDGPLEHRRHAELPAARAGSRHRHGQARRRPERPCLQKTHREHGRPRRPHTRRLHRGRHLDRDVTADRDHLGREYQNLRRCRLRLPPHLPQQMRRGRAQHGR
jgi:hypothetical protein